MRKGNVTSDEGFLILGFSDFPQLQVPLFAALLMIYIATVMGNILVLGIIYSTSHLQTPMYFFLTNLSFLDIVYTSVIFPLVLVHFFLQGIHISFTGCLLQVHFSMCLVTLEFIILSVMAYDRYVAICNPLLYITIMNKALCIRLATGSWVIGQLLVTPHTVLISGLSFCASHEINHFFCDVTALLKLSCTSTLIIEEMIYLFGGLVAMMSFLLISTSYVSIISVILKIKSVQQRQKAFSTCASHLTVVILFFVSVCSTYLRPPSTLTMSNNKILSLLYTILTPLCNPIIYSINNTEFRQALKKKKIKTFSLF